MEQQATDSKSLTELKTKTAFCNNDMTGRQHVRREIWLG